MGLLGVVIKNPRLYQSLESSLGPAVVPIDTAEASIPVGGIKIVTPKRPPVGDPGSVGLDKPARSGGPAPRGHGCQVKSTSGLVSAMGPLG